MKGEQQDLLLMHKLAFFYWKHAQHERAAAMAFAALKLGMNDTRLVCLLALTLLNLGQPARSLVVLDGVDAGHNDELERTIRSLRARALLHLGHVDQARAEFKLVALAVHVNQADVSAQD